jgi:hypothetical protein
MPSSAFLTPAKRFAGIVNGLFHAVAVRRDAGFLAQPVAMLLWARLAHLRARITRLAARLADGKGSGVPRNPRTPSGTAPKPRRPPQRLLPRKAGWLIPLVPEAAAAGSQLRHLLADPEMAALIEAAPQMGRLLRPLCRSLGVILPPDLLPPPRGTETAKAATTRGAAPAGTGQRHGCLALPRGASGGMARAEPALRRARPALAQRPALQCVRGLKPGVTAPRRRTPT